MGQRSRVLPAPTDPSLFEQTRLAELVNHVEGDVRDMDAVEAAVNAARPEVVFHLAAQSLVRYSYDNPIETYATNVMGTCISSMPAVVPKASARSSPSPATNAMKTASGSGRTGKAIRWAGTTHTAAARAQPSW